jgi:hypothetical protein
VKNRKAEAISTSQWERLPIILAVISPLPYGFVRWAWAAGIPLGVSEETWVAVNATFSDSLAEFILGGMHIGGAILTLGLIQKWGEIFPRWTLFLSGKRIPVFLVIVPAVFASAIITIAGLKTGIQLISGMVDGSITIDMSNWGEFGPVLFWLPWGISLGFVTLFYYLRRRGSCKHCGSVG